MGQGTIQGTNMRKRAVAVCIGLLLLPGAAAMAQPGTLPAVPLSPPANAPWFDSSRPVPQRAAALVSQMTLEEKGKQLVNRAEAIPRLGVPAYNWWSEALHGVAIPGFTTVFPEPVGLAATFDPDLIHAMAVAISTEARVRYNRERREGMYGGLDFWSPNINIFRDPRWGRGQETYGEDPFLTAQLGVAFVRGLQGEDAEHPRTIATPKHYAVHSGPEPTRHAMDVTVSKHDQLDTYTPAFRAAVIDGKAGSVMCAYNRVNGQPACANDFLLNDLLRSAWNFKGYVTSDCGAIRDIHEGHHFTKTLAEAAAVSLKHGVDTDCADFGEGPVAGAKAYSDAVAQGLVPQSVMDQSLQRLFEARIRLGMFDAPEASPYASIPDSAMGSPAHRALALRTARESMVLLKNNGVLPLAKPKRILVVGPLADQVDVLYGNYNGTAKNPVTALDGIRAQFPGADVTFEAGTDFLHKPLPVPASALSGLKAEIFKGTDFSGAPFQTRTDTQIAFERGLNPFGSGDIMVRWTGKLTPAESGSYQIGLEGLDAKLWLDGELIADSPAKPSERGAITKTMTLQKGHAYDLRVEVHLRDRFALKLVWNRLFDRPLDRAVAAARKADIVIAVAGITSALEGEEMKVDVPGFVGGDRTSLDMPKQEEDLLKAVRPAAKKLVVVLMNGSALSVNWAAKNADAILDAWYPGGEGGTAIAQTLAGDNNPSGHLPVTFYTGTDQLPDFNDYSMSGRTYRYFTGKPLYPFGHGLSYTKFAYDGLKLAPSLKAGENLGVDVTVKNTGSRYGDAVAQLYLGFPGAPGMPVRALRGFSRVALKAGESRKIHFELSPRDLSSVTPDGARVVAPGAYRISVGEGQPGTGAATASGRFTMTGTAPLPD